MLLGLPKFRKKYGNGVSIVTVGIKPYTTTLIRSEGEGKQLVSFAPLNRSYKRDLDKRSNIFIYDQLLDPHFL